MAREDGQSRMVHAGAPPWRVRARELGIVAGAQVGSVSRCRLVLAMARELEAAHDCAFGEQLGGRALRIRNDARSAAFSSCVGRVGGQAG